MTSRSARNAQRIAIAELNRRTGDATDADQAVLDGLSASDRRALAKASSNLAATIWKKLAG